MNQKIINNAISAYFGLGGLLLLPSKNQNIQNDFVRSHAKMALFLHTLFIVNYIIFIFYKLFAEFHIPVVNYPLNDTIALGIFLVLFALLLYGAFQAKNGKVFGKSEFQNVTRTSHLFEIKNSQLNEEGNLTFILSYIPFIGYYLHSKLKSYNNQALISNTKMNLYFSLFLSFLFILGYKNIVSIFILSYIVGIIFFAISLISQQKVIIFQTKYLLFLEELYNICESIIVYLKNYFSKSTTFEGISNIYIKVTEKNRACSLQDQKILGTKSEGKIPFFLYYFPIINIVGLFDYQSKYKNHIINGIIITFFTLVIFFSFSYNLLLFLLFPIAFGLGSKEDIGYRFAFFSQIYDGVIDIFQKLLSFGKTTKKLHKEVSEISYEINK